jgi:hypothetical protein
MFAPALGKKIVKMKKLLGFHVGRFIGFLYMFAPALGKKIVKMEKLLGFHVARFIGFLRFVIID